MFTGTGSDSDWHKKNTPTAGKLTLYSSALPLVKCSHMEFHTPSKKRPREFLLAAQFSQFPIYSLIKTFTVSLYFTFHLLPQTLIDCRSCLKLLSLSGFAGYRPSLLTLFIHSWHTWVQEVHAACACVLLKHLLFVSRVVFSWSHNTVMYLWSLVLSLSFCEMKKWRRWIHCGTDSSWHHFFSSSGWPQTNTYPQRAALCPRCTFDAAWSLDIRKSSTQLMEMTSKQLRISVGTIRDKKKTTDFPSEYNIYRSPESACFIRASPKLSLSKVK